MRRIRTAVLISGNGSNLQALLDATAATDSPAEITLVLSNKADAFGLERAKKAGVPTVVISHKDYSTREAFDEAMDFALRTHNIELVCLAGFMRVLSSQFVERWTGRLINIHPSLLPLYRGLNTHARVLEAGDATHGCTVHWVIPALDEGEAIAQASLNVLPGETAEQLQQRVHALEHQLYPAALKKVAARLLGIS